MERESSVCNVIDEEGKGRERREEGKKWSKEIKRQKGEVKRIDGPQSLRSSGDVPFEFGGTRDTEEYRVCHGRRKERKR